MSGPAQDPRDLVAARQAQAVNARVHARTLTEASAPVYEGLVTRGIAFAIDSAVVNLVALIVSVSVGLALSVLDPSANVEQAALAVGGAAYVVWSVGYFVTFWSTTGQTPGDRLLQIRVCRAADGDVLRPRKSLLRFGAMMLCALPLFAGFLPILVDNRRRGPHDRLAGSVVVSAPVEPRPGRV
jgi:uncharacterized RDD family membrane protein YckC